MVGGQGCAPEHGEHVERERRLPEPPSIRRGESYSRHHLPELLRIIEVPLQISAVEEVGGAEHLDRGPAFDQLANQERPRIGGVLEICVVGLVAVSCLLEGIDGDSRVYTEPQHAAQVVREVCFAREVDVVVGESPPPVDQKRAIAELDVPLHLDVRPGALGEGRIPQGQHSRRSAFSRGGRRGLGALRTLPGVGRFRRGADAGMLGRGEGGRLDHGNLRTRALRRKSEPQHEAVWPLLDGVADGPTQVYDHPRRAGLPLATTYLANGIMIGRERPAPGVAGRFQVDDDARRTVEHNRRVPGRPTCPQDHGQPLILPLDVHLGKLDQRAPAHGDPPLAGHDRTGRRGSESAKGDEGGDGDRPPSVSDARPARPPSRRRYH